MDINKMSKEEINILLNEGLLSEGVMDNLKKKWQGIKHQVSKLGRTQKGGKFVGKDKVNKAAEDQLENEEIRISKELENEMLSASKDILKLFIEEFKKKYPGFPNIKEKDKFKEAVDASTGSIYLFYKKIYDAPSKDPNDPEYLPPVIANSIIKYLRMWVEKLIDYDLAQVYQYMENKESKKSLLEDDGNPDQNTTEQPQEPKKEGPLTGTEDTHTKKVLKSQWLPALLGIAGGMGLGWVLKSAFFSGVISKAKTPEDIIQAFDQAKVKFGNGLTQTMQTITGGKYETVGDFKAHLAKIGGGSWQRGIEQLGSIMAPANKVGMTVGQQQKVLEYMINNSQDGEPIAKIFGTNSNFFKSSAEKLMGKVINTTNAYGNMTGMPFASQLDGVLTAVKLIKGGSAFGAAASVGIVSMPLAALGLGVVSAGAILGFLRRKGKKQSRFKDLDVLLVSMKYFEEGTKGDPVSSEGPNAISKTDKKFVEESGKKEKEGKPIYNTPKTPTQAQPTDDATGDDGQPQDDSDVQGDQQDQQDGQPQQTQNGGDTAAGNNIDNVQQPSTQIQKGSDTAAGNDQGSTDQKGQEQQSNANVAGEIEAANKMLSSINPLMQLITDRKDVFKDINNPPQQVKSDNSQDQNTENQNKQTTESILKKIILKILLESDLKMDLKLKYILQKTHGIPVPVSNIYSSILDKVSDTIAIINDNMNTFPKDSNIRAMCVRIVNQFKNLNSLTNFLVVRDINSAEEVANIANSMKANMNAIYSNKIKESKFAALIYFVYLLGQELAKYAESNKANIPSPEEKEVSTHEESVKLPILAKKYEKDMNGKYTKQSAMDAIFVDENHNGWIRSDLFSNGKVNPEKVQNVVNKGKYINLTINGDFKDFKNLRGVILINKFIKFDENNDEAIEKGEMSVYFDSKFPIKK